MRYNANAMPAEVRAIDATRFEVRFAEPQFAVAPGQASLVYDGERVLGGGWIGRGSQVRKKYGGFSVLACTKHPW